MTTDERRARAICERTNLSWQMAMAITQDIAASDEAAGMVLQEWRDIETAPRDGTPIDLWHRNGVRITDSWWDAEDGIWVGLWSDEEITHWLPLSCPAAYTEEK